ncbi:MAG: tyrosine-type recombinase/integrase [Actinomycetota bacterium]|nr:tyrosine-type recombinase/integrase [Actinomycetota bacterium]
MLLDTGMRIGEALGLRHEDLHLAERHVVVMPRRNDNRAHTKSGRIRTIPASAELMRLYADYLNNEYGSSIRTTCSSTCGAAHMGPLCYPAVYDLVRRLRRSTGITFGPHLFRHTYATWLLRKGAGMESVKKFLGHASVTDYDTYGHLRDRK